MAITLVRQERGLPTNGKRFTLAERLSAALQAQARQPGADSPMLTSLTNG